MKTIQLGSKKFVLMAAALFMALLVIGIVTKGCSSDGGSSNIFVEAPGEPTNFTVVATAAGGDLSATLSWSAPTTGGKPASYKIYRSDKNTPEDPVFDPGNWLFTITAEANKTDYEYIDNAGLERGVTTYWVVTAKNAGGETSALPQGYTPPGGGGGEVDTYGNNFAAAMIFADGYGISGLPITGSWTNVVADIDYNTGVRPTIEENVSELPHFDPTTAFVLDGVTYYKQKTASTWQGEWISTGTPDTQHVTAAWGDNLISQTLNTESIVRVEMVLSKALVDTNMTSYKMVSLYGTKDVEIYGTDGTTYENNNSFVFATNARLTIQKMNGDVVESTEENQTLFDPGVLDGPGKFGAEINVAGNLTYGYVWDLKQNPVPAGTYRITFSLDGTSVPTGTLNNTIIDAVAVPTEGDPSTFPVLDSGTSTHIDIVIH